MMWTLYLQCYLSCGPYGWAFHLVQGPDTGWGPCPGTWGRWFWAAEAE